MGENSELIKLKKRWLIVSLAGYLTLVCMFVLLSALWKPGIAITWGITASLGLFYLVWLLWRNLDKNHRHKDPTLLPTLGPGNTLTLVRGALLAFLAGFLFLPQPFEGLAWIPAIIFTLAIAADFFDGYLARVSNHVTRLGEILDMSIDGIGILVAVLLAIRYGQLPAWYLAVPLARYLFLVGIYIRNRSGCPVYELPYSVRRRAFAGLQMGFISVMLWPIFKPPGTYVAALIFAVPFLIGFLLDWLFISGNHHPVTVNRFMDARRLVATGLPIALRLSLLGSLILFSQERLNHYSSRLSTYSALDLSSDVPMGTLIFLIETIVMIWLVLGAAGRLASIAGLLLLGVDQILGSLQPAQYLLIVVYILMIYLGTGPYSLWKPEDRLIFLKAGEASKISVEVSSTAPSGD